MTKDDAVPVTAELLPCPFCGGPAKADNEESEDVGGYFVSCTKCPVSAWGDGRPEAITAWNLRHRGSTAGVDVEKELREGLEAARQSSPGFRIKVLSDTIVRVLASLSQTPATPMDELQRLGQEFDGEEVEPRYLIRKNGYFYRPNAEGYTLCAHDAGRFTLEEAIRYSHPNGADGPRDGITYELAPPATPSPKVQEGLREATEEALEVLGYIFETSDDHHAAMKAEVAWRKLDAALSATPAQEGERCPKCGSTTGNDWTQCEGSCPMPQSPHFATDAPPVDETDRRTAALIFIDKFFEPWGAWKTAWWEGEVSDDAAFSADNALKHVANILRRAALADRTQEGEVRRG